MTHTLVAVFDNQTVAEQAKAALLAKGFSGPDITLSGNATDLAGNAGEVGSDDAHESVAERISHFFSNLFGTDHEGHRVYSEAVSRGKTVLTLHCESEQRVETAADIVEEFGPIDIDEHASQWQAQTMTGATAAGLTQRATGSPQRQSKASPGAGASVPGNASVASGSMQRAEAASAAEAGQRIPVIAEDMKVGKRSVERGGVRVYQRTVETPVHEVVKLREEHVKVERVPVDRPVDPAQLKTFQDQSIELRERAEEAIVQKTARVVEEVVVSKEVTEREQTIDDTLRRTDVKVEQLGGSAYESQYRNHWKATYGASAGAYEDYAPAYQYGSSMRADKRYANRQWADAESDLRADWEASNPGSAWEKFKAAVKNGWDQIVH